MFILEKFEFQKAVSNYEKLFSTLISNGTRNNFFDLQKKKFLFLIRKRF